MKVKEDSILLGLNWYPAKWDKNGYIIKFGNNNIKPTKKNRFNLFNIKENEHKIKKVSKPVTAKKCNPVKRVRENSAQTKLTF